MNSLAERLKTARESIGKGQKEMAIACNASYRMWQAYEMGENQPNSKVFEALVKLGFNANWLLTGEGEMRRGAEPGTVVYTLDQEQKAEVNESLKRYGVYPLDQGLLKRSLEGACEWIKDEGIEPTPEIIFNIMMYRYQLVATIKFGSLKSKDGEE